MQKQKESRPHAPALHCFHFATIGYSSSRARRLCKQRIGGGCGRHRHRYGGQRRAEVWRCRWRQHVRRRAQRWCTVVWWCWQWRDHSRRGWPHLAQALPLAARPTRVRLAQARLAQARLAQARVPEPSTGARRKIPSAKCPVTGTLPAYADLKADGKLPDPFMKLDGTRIKDKSEWACRRAEIVKQLAKYIYGEKPIPAKGSVTGTVSATSISVKVTEGSKTASFTATVNMNGATAPAPAIISYGAGATAPSGVARITFTAVEASGGSGAKTGPF